MTLKGGQLHCRVTFILLKGDLLLPARDPGLRRLTLLGSRCGTPGRLQLIDREAFKLGPALLPSGRVLYRAVLAIRVDHPLQCALHGA
jgi:hypothetical protein